MTTYLAGMIDQLRDLLDDDADSQVPFARKVRYLNRGQAAMFPKVFNLASDTSITLADDDYEYTIPSTISVGKILTVEYETSSTSSRYTRMDRYEIIPASHTGSILKLGWDPATAFNGSSVRITAAVPLTAFTSADYTAAGSEAYTGPDYTAELPVYYAMSLAHMQALDARLDYGKYSVQTQNNAAEPVDIMGAAQYYMERFTVLLEQLAMPLPTAGI